MARHHSQPSLPMQLRLPHPWCTSYTIEVAAFDAGLRQFRIRPSIRRNGETLHEELHKNGLLWTEPKPSSQEKEQQDFCTRPESVPVSTLFWTGTRPSVGQAWLAAYGLLSLYPRLDSILITLHGASAASVGTDLCRVGLLVADPSTNTQQRTQPTAYLLLRSSFWQGAGSPFGPRPAWLPSTTTTTSSSSSSCEHPPLPAPSAALDTSAPTPLRAPTPAPGTTVYSRFLPHLSQHLTLRVSDRTAPAATLPLLAHLDAAPPLALFELYWVRDRVSDHIGEHFACCPFDRGVRAVLAPGAPAEALWGGVVHYAFLDEARTARVFGVPARYGGADAGYEGEFPFSVTGRVGEGVGVGEEALAVYGREGFFQRCPFVGEEGRGEEMGAMARL